MRGYDVDGDVTFVSDESLALGTFVPDSLVRDIPGEGTPYICMLFDHDACISEDFKGLFYRIYASDEGVANLIFMKQPDVIEYVSSIYENQDLPAEIWDIDRWDALVAVLQKDMREQRKN